MKNLVLNSGSSSQKVSRYEIGDGLPENPPVPVWEGRIEWNGNSAAITVRNSIEIARKEKLNNPLLVRMGLWKSGPPWTTR